MKVDKNLTISEKTIVTNPQTFRLYEQLLELNQGKAESKYNMITKIPAIFTSNAWLHTCLLLFISYNMAAADHTVKTQHYKTLIQTINKAIREAITLTIYSHEQLLSP